MKTHRNVRKQVIRGIACLMMLCLAAFPAAAKTTGKAATAKTTKAKTAKTAVKKKKVVTKWVTDGAYSYYYKNGKKQKNFVTVGDKTYYFSYKKGKQRIGWRYIKGYYYFFRQVYGKDGYMLKNCEVDGIRLNKKGRAKVRNSEVARKLKVLWNYQHWADLFMRPGLSNGEKLAACLAQIRKFHYRNEPDTFQVGAGDWDVVCAEEVYARKNDYWPTAECFRMASAFAYLANAAGFQDVRVCARPGHGWSRVNGTFYDATLVISRGSMEWFPVAAGHLGEYTVWYERSLN